MLHSQNLRDSHQAFYRFQRVDLPEWSKHFPQLERQQPIATGGDCLIDRSNFIGALSFQSRTLKQDRSAVVRADGIHLAKIQVDSRASASLDESAGNEAPATHHLTSNSQHLSSVLLR